MADICIKRQIPTKARKKSAAVRKIINLQHNGEFATLDSVLGEPISRVKTEDSERLGAH